MKKNLLAVLTVLTFVAFTPSYGVADDVEHYVGQEFKNKAVALTALKETSAQMAVLAGDKELDDAKMEQIHEISYTAEDAVGVLEKKGGKTKALAVALEEVHLASENHKPEELKTHFIVYQSELMAYLLK